ncbi:MAG: hypothetical protein AB8F95_12660 [Bacteroidia bacterium]
MRFYVLSILLLSLIAACGPAIDENSNANEATITDFVLRPHVASGAFGEALPQLAETVGKPVALKGNAIHIVDGGQLYEIPVDSAMAWLERPSMFRDPSKTLGDYLKGDAPAVFTYDIYNPFPDTWIDSISLDSYRLQFKGEDLEIDSLYKGHLSLSIQNQMHKAVTKLELRAEVKRKRTSGSNCKVAPFVRTIIIEDSIPPFSQKSFIHTTTDLAAHMDCKGQAMNKMSYQAVFKLLRYQVEGDSSWLDATKRTVLVK